MPGRTGLILIAAGALAACQGSRQQARSGTATGAAAPAASGQSNDARERAEQSAQQQAPSAVPQEGVGGHDPRPLPTGPQAQARYGEGTPPAPGTEGRVPDPRLPSAGTGGAAASPDARDELSGRVALVDAGEHEIAIDSGTGTTQVKVADSARITVDGKQASFADIRQGAVVRARLDRSGDQPQAIQLDVTPSKAKK